MMRKIKIEEATPGMLVTPVDTAVLSNDVGEEARYISQGVPILVLASYTGGVVGDTALWVLDVLAMGVKGRVCDAGDRRCLYVVADCD